MTGFGSIDSSSSYQMNKSGQFGSPKGVRPFKYLKHKGPRPTRGSMSIRRSFETGSFHLRPDSNNYSDPCLEETRSRPEPTYRMPITSRLLRSRNLNLSALDISACKTPSNVKLEIVRDEPGSSGRPLTALTTGSQRMSCFSDGSTSASTSRPVSYLLRSDGHLSPLTHHDGRKTDDRETGRR